MRYLLALALALSLSAKAQQSTLGRLSAGAFGTNATILYPESGDVSVVVGTNPPSGKVYVLGPGIYWCSNWMKCPTNGAIVGSGAGSTILISTLQNGIPAPLIACSDNGYVADLTITNFFFDVAGAGNPAACIGTHRNLAVTNNNAVQVGQGGFTNFLVERTVLYGGSDTIYIRHTNNTQITTKYSKLFGPWDVEAVFETGTNQSDFWYCDFYHQAAATHGNAKDILVASAGASARFRAYYCNFYKTNGIQADDYYLNLSDSPTKCSAEFYYCSFTNANPGQSKFLLGAGPFAPVILQNCNLSLAEVGDDVSTTTGLNLGTNVATTFAFAGDSLNGVKPYLTTSGAAGNDIIASPSTQIKLGTASSFWFATNLATAAPDFNVAVSLLPVAVNTTFTAPVNVDTTKTSVQHVVMMVTNSAAGTIVLTMPANARSVGSTTVTRLSQIDWWTYAQKFTNVIITPIF